MSKSDYTPDGLVRELLRGVTTQERATGMSSHFELEYNVHTPGTQPLLTYFRGVETKDGVAFVDFESGALRYLNASACTQAAVKSPLERTLIELPSISEVLYRIDGVFFDKWDA